jgi:hypothetical protein
VEEQEERPDSSAARWSKRVGIGAFLFFLVKGLLWLIVPALIAYCAMK